MKAKNNPKEPVPEQHLIRVRPKSFYTDWRADLKALGISMASRVKEVRYTPVNYSVQPYTLEIDLLARRLNGRVVGVIPNCTYGRYIYSWSELMRLLGRDA